MSQLIFFEPHLSFYVPSEQITDFIRIISVSSLSGVVTSLSIYRIIVSGEGVKKIGKGFLGTLIGTVACACSCTSLGFTFA
ncbi:MAG: hypothetical protein KGI33_07825 [Thaumarchaeota archaeon]|nr:hypothetical protein [Nitrososphaerota archaeon]